MVKIYYLLFLLFSVQLVSAQCMIQHVPLAQRVQQAGLVIEGRVISKTCVHDDLDYNIYTIYTIEVNQIFKGSCGSTVKVIELGGIIGLEMEVATNTLKLSEGHAGVFELSLHNSQYFDASNNYYEFYAATQGALMYDVEHNEILHPFEDYQNFAQSVYTDVIAITGQQPTQVKPLDFSQVKSYGFESHTHHHGTAKSSNPVATSVSPSGTITGYNTNTISAGRFEVLVINGTGFGATQGSSFVAFENADNPGTLELPKPSQYISWSNTQIQVQVPESAGTGNVRVSDGTNTITGPAITVPYAISNLSYDADGAGTVAVDSAYIAKHVNRNGTGGYTFRPYTGFSANVPAKTDLTNVIDQWSCASGINWKIGADTSLNVSASDNVNIVRFDIGSELAAGVLGVAVSRFSGCLAGGTTIKWYVKEIDITIDDGTTWFYGNVGTPTFSQLDFYTVMLHEVGHAIQLGHVIDNNKVMHYAVSAGVQKRVINATELLGAKYMVDTINTVGVCGQGAHIKYICNPPVTLSAASTTINENGGSTTITVTIPGVNNDPVTVNLAVSGTASGADFTLPLTITIPPGSTSASVTLASTDDNLYEGDETVIIDITSVTNGTEATPQQVTVTIADNETAPKVTLSVSPTTLTEGSGASATVTCSLNNATSLPVIVTLSFSGSASSTTDYSCSTSVVIPALSTSASVTLSTINDAIAELQEQVIIDINTVTNATEDGTQTATVTINDDESAPQISFAATTSSVNENNTAAQSITISSNKQASYPINITCTLAGTASGSGTDYTATTLNLTIPAGSTSTTFTFSTVDDAIFEGNETIVINLASASTPATLGSTTQHTVTITDNETAPNVTLGVTNTSIAEPSTSTTLTLTLSNPSTLVTRVVLAYTGDAESTDYTKTDTVNITAGSTTATFTITAVDDNIDEPNESIIVDIASVINGNESGTQQATITINDNDATPILSISAAPSTIAEAGGTATVTVSINNPSESTITVNLGGSGTASPSDYSLGSTSLTMPALSLSSTTVLTAVNDANDEPNETVVVKITGAINATHNSDSTVVTIMDDDSATLVLNVGGTTVNNGDTITLSSILNTGTSGTATINISNSGNSSLTYTVGTTSSLVTSIINGSGTVAAGTSGTAQLNLLANCSNLDTAYATVVVTSNAAGTGTKTFTVKVPVVDAAPPVPNVSNLNFTASCDTTVTAPSATDACEGTIVGTTTNPTTFTANGTYVINWTYTDSKGNAATQVQTVTIANKFNGSAIANIPICNGVGTITVSATGGSGNYTGVAANSVTQPGTYTYTVSDNVTGCKSNVSATIDQAIKVDINNTSTSDTVCASTTYNAASSITLNTNVTGTASTYLWSGSGAQFSSTNMASTSVSVPQGSHQVIVQVSNNDGCIAKDTIVLFGHPKPTMTLSSTLIEACFGNSITLSATTTPNLPVSWSGGAVNNQPFVVGPSTIYTATATSAAGCTVTRTVDVQTSLSMELSLFDNITQQSTAGNECSILESVEGSLVTHTDASCNFICSIADLAGNAKLGEVEVCLWVDPAAPKFNGINYAPRYFEITPTTNAPSEVRLYFTQDDLNKLDAALIADGLSPINANQATGSAAARITKVTGGLLPAAPSALSIIPVTLNWLAPLNAWEAKFFVTSFSGFYLGAAIVPLAIEPTITLSAQKKEQYDELTYTAANTLSNTTYELYTGTTAQTLKPELMIGVASSSTFGYDGGNLAYYQVVGHMPNGVDVYSNVVRIQRNEMLLYPNPTNEILNVAFNAQSDDKVTIEIFDVTGRLVSTQSIDAHYGDNLATVNVGKLASGNYQLKLVKIDGISMDATFTKH